MLKKISVIKARQHLDELLAEVCYNSSRFLVKQRSKAMAVIIPVEEYEIFLKQREEDFKVFDEIRAKNKGVKLEDVERDVEAASRAVRARHAKSRAQHQRRRKRDDR